MGDSVYLDAPWKLTPRQAYHQLLENTGFRLLTWNVPTFFLMDDHEIYNDASDNRSAFFQEAARTFDSYLGDRNQGEGQSKVRYHSFWSGTAAFLILDTRSQRDPDHPTTMLGA